MGAFVARAVLFPHKSAPSRWGDPDPRLMCVSWAHVSLPPYDISIDSVFFARLTVVANTETRQTHRPRLAVRSNIASIYAMHAMRLNNFIGRPMPALVVWRSAVSLRQSYCGKKDITSHTKKTVCSLCVCAPRRLRCSLV